MSIGSVSDILNLRAGRSYSAEARSKVMEAVRAMGYVSNRRAQMLARHRSNEIGFLFTRDFRNPYFAETVERMRQHVLAHGGAPVLELRPDWYSAGDQIARSMFVDGAAGLIVGPIYSPEDLTMVRRIRATGERVIFFGGRIDDGSDLVAMDLYQGGRLAALHAVESGHKSIAYLGHKAIGLTIEKAAGIRDVLREAGCLQDASFHPVDFTTAERLHKSVEAFVRAWFDRPASQRHTACLCMNDHVASFAMNAFRNAGVAVPQQVSFIGYDDIREARYFFPPLTTIDGGLGEQIRVASQLITRWTHEDAPPTKQVVLEPRLVERESVCPPDTTSSSVHPRHP